MKLHKIVIFIFTICISLFFASNTFAAIINSYSVKNDFKYTAEKVIKGTIITKKLDENNGRTLSTTEKLHTFDQIKCDTQACYFEDRSEISRTGLDEGTKKSLYSGLLYRVTDAKTSSVGTYSASDTVQIYTLEDDRIDINSGWEKAYSTNISIDLNGKTTEKTTDGDTDGDPSNNDNTSNQKAPEDFQYETPASWSGKWDSIFKCDGGTCDSYEEWISVIWAWALVIAIPLSVLVLSAAGVVWMTSEGNPDRISFAKKLILGVFSGLGLILIAHLLLVNIIGLDTETWNIN